MISMDESNELAYNLHIGTKEEHKKSWRDKKKTQVKGTKVIENSNIPKTPFYTLVGMLQSNFT